MGNTKNFIEETKETKSNTRESVKDKKIEQLEKMGLRVPQITKIMIALKEKGYDISDGILTVEQAFYQLVDLLKKEGKL